MSVFEFYSFAQVTEDKPDGSDLITAWPIEKLPLEQGKVSESSREYKPLPRINSTLGVTYNLLLPQLLKTVWFRRSSNY